MSDADINFYFDPVCPFAWMTSKWVRLVQAERDFPAGYEAGHTARLRLLWVAARARAEHGRAAIGPLYAALGERIFDTAPDRKGSDGGYRGTRTFLEPALVAAGLPSWPTHYGEAARWCGEVNAALHSKDHRSPGRAARARTWPAGRVAVAAPGRHRVRPVSRKVDKLSCVRFGSARYSVPNRLIGATVLLATVDARVQVLEPFTGELVAEHALVVTPNTIAHPDTSHRSRSRPPPVRHRFAATRSATTVPATMQRA